MNIAANPIASIDQFLADLVDLCRRQVQLAKLFFKLRWCYFFREVPRPQRVDDL
jgi:hypothetical protein